mmetsp:Transcript_3442/g.12359  ORF Transcript_3442/g.12359 Transcript_3442/m.12359 type:complete len:620 (-) Transcript_3442:874-2733(-)
MAAVSVQGARHCASRVRSRRRAQSSTNRTRAAAAATATTTAAGASLEQLLYRSNDAESLQRLVLKSYAEMDVHTATHALHRLRIVTSGDQSRAPEAHALLKGHLERISRGGEAEDDPLMTDKEVTKAILKSENWAQALAELERLKPSGYSAYAASAAIAACASASPPRWRDALTVLRGCAAPDAVAFACAIRACGLAGAADAALDLLEREMPRRGVAPTAEVREACASACTRSGRYEDAKRALRNAPYSEPISKATRRRWRERSRDHLRAVELTVAGERGVGSVSDEDAAASAALERSLGVAATHGTMPSFSHGGARWGYTCRHLSSRAGRVADLLYLAEAPWLRARVAEMLLASPRLGIVSLGGGPAFDFAALSCLADYLGPGLPNCPVPPRNARPTAAVEALVLDYEIGWSECAAAVVHARAAVSSCDDDKESASRHSCDFGRGDICSPLFGSSANAAAVARVASTDCFVCSYCVAENAVKLRRGDFRFFRELFAAAKPSALFVFTETTHRLWPELSRVAFETFFVATDAEADSDARFDIATPVLANRTGYALVFAKPESSRSFASSADRRLDRQDAEEADARFEAALSDETRALLRRFAADNESHERRLKRSGAGA